MKTRVDWGAPLRFERRLVPAVTAAASLALHSVFLFSGCLRSAGDEFTEPRLHAKRARFALIVPPAGTVRETSEKETSEVVPRPAVRPRRTERESILGPRPREIELPEARLARSEKEARPSRAERVTVAGRGGPQMPSIARPAEGGVRSARLLEGPGKPRYPSACREQNLEGEGEYVLAIDETGRVDGVRVLKSAGHRAFDDSAVLFFLHRARYDPATLEGVPIPCSLRQQVAFELDGR